jgi:hypothetical protein
MRPVALPYLSYDRLTATNFIALEDKANTAHTYMETCVELTGYLCRKRAIPSQMLDFRRSIRHASLHASNGYKFYFTDRGPLAKCSVF